ncbi:hypothetical protein [Cupriavidus sp. D39]|uniref:hypothetical protein n=1 Tax=Cupriavidus sp. D39 TaxID=2997877 RepID=UPI003B63D23A
MRNDDGSWSIAVEGLGRIMECPSREMAIRLATDRAIAAGVVLYVHQGNGQFDWWKDFFRRKPGTGALAVPRGSAKAVYRRGRVPTKPPRASIMLRRDEAARNVGIADSRSRPDFSGDGFSTRIVKAGRRFCRLRSARLRPGTANLTKPSDSLVN